MVEFPDLCSASRRLEARKKEVKKHWVLAL